MPCKKIIVVTTYDLRTDDLWDIRESLKLEYSLDNFPAFWKPCRVSEKLCLLIIFLQLGES